MDFTFGRVMEIVDSLIVRTQIQREPYGFCTYVATRIAEIQMRAQHEEWLWISSENDVADFTTRSFPPWVLKCDSAWQNGLEYLTRPIDEWPVSQLCDNELPDKIGMLMKCDAKSDEKEQEVIDVQRFSTYNKLIKTTSRIYTAFELKSFNGIRIIPSQEILSKAEMFWVKRIQLDLRGNCLTKYKKLGPCKGPIGVILLGQKIVNWLKDNSNQDYYSLTW